MLERLRQECYNIDNDDYVNQESFLYKVSDEYFELYSYGIYEDIVDFLNKFDSEEE